MRAAGVPPELPHLGHADAEPPAEIETATEAEAEEVVAAVADAISPTHHAAGHDTGHGHH